MRASVLKGRSFFWEMYVFSLILTFYVLIVCEF